MFWKNPRLWRVLRVLFPLLLTLLWLGFIFGNSLKDAAASSEQSGKVHEIVNEVASSVGVDEPISEQTVRNMAHFTEFAILGALLCLDVWTLGISPLFAKRRFDVLWLLAALPVCFLLACTDEYLQTFSDGRASDFSDVLTDTAGASLGIALFLALFLLCRLAFGKKKPLT
ncbi:MAG: VanZ family protein [Clostridia bacterium]|nr:VanZ family protein [Clostridia bacterium]